MPLPLTIGTMRALLAPLVDAGRYPLFRELFTSVVSRNASPGNGKLTMTGTNWIADGVDLRGGGALASSWGDNKAIGSQLDGSGFAHVAGRTLLVTLIPEDTISSADFCVSLASASNIGDPRTDGFGVTQEGGKLYVVTPGTKLPFDTSSRFWRPKMYMLGLTLLDVGFIPWITSSGADVGFNETDPLGVPAWPSARVLTPELSQTLAAAFPSIQAYRTLPYPNKQLFRDLRLVDVSAWSSGGIATFLDRFTRANSASAIGNGWATASGVTAGISGNQVYLPSSGSGFHRSYKSGVLSGGDSLVVCDIVWPTTTPTSAGIGIMPRRVDDNNYIRLWSNGAAQIVLQSWVAGGFGATIYSTGYTWQAGHMYRFYCWMNGNKYRFIIVDLTAGTVTEPHGGGWVTDSNNTFLSATDAGLYSFSNAVATEARWDNFAVFPHTFTLPAEVQTAGYQPVQATPGAIIGQASFTAANGNITGYTPALGPALTMVNGTGAISSNALALSGSGTLLASQAQSTPYVEVSVDVVTPASFPNGRIRAGLAVRVANTNNHVIARLFKDPSQISNDEIELIETSGGSGNITKKVNIGATYATSTTYAMKMRIVPDPKGGADLVEVWLSGSLLLSHKLTTTQISSNVGVYRDATDDDGCTFKNLVVKVIPALTPQVSVLDTFNRANADTLGANWGANWESVGVSQTPGIRSNAATIAVAPPNFVAPLWTPTTYTDVDVIETVTFSDWSVITSLDLLGRYSGSDPANPILIDAYIYGTSIEIDEYTPDYNTIYTGTLNITPTTGDKLWLHLSGATVQLYLYHGGNWNLIASATTSVTSAGNVGFYLGFASGSASVDDFSAGAL